MIAQRVLLAASSPATEIMFRSAMDATTEIDVPGSAHWRTVIAGAASGTYDALLIDSAFDGFNVTDLAYLVAACPDLQIVVDALDHRLARRLNGFPKDRLLLVPNRDPQTAKRVIRMALNPTLDHPGEPLRVPGIVAVAASTGGPGALDEFFRCLPSAGPPIVVVQHMPVAFVPRLARRLNRVGGYRVDVATEGDPLTSSSALICPGGLHLEVRRGRISLMDTGPVGGLIPRADITFESVAALYRHRTLGVVLTGLGDDGLAGAQAIVGSGGQVAAQDHESSVIDGMPGNVRRSGLASVIGDPQDLAEAIGATWRAVAV